MRKGRRGKTQNPPKKELRIAAIMTVPRLGFTDHFINAYDALSKIGIPLIYKQGVFWGQGLENGIQDLMNQYELDYVLTLDYDSIFNVNDILELAKLAMSSDADVVYPLQSMRGVNNDVLRLPTDDPLVLTDIGHFGLTLLKVSMLEKLPHPWFLGTPNEEGEWREGKTDDDIHFWNIMNENGFKICLANNVYIGHLEILVKWPGKIYQPMSDFYKDGKPPIEAMKAGIDRLRPIDEQEVSFGT